MIVRGLRSPSRIKTDNHKNLQHTIQDLQKQNKELRLQVLKVEQRLLEAQQSKRKYKTKYREAKQKIQILGLVGGLYTQKQQMDQFDGCLSPRTKATRIKTASQDDFLSFKVGMAQSEVQENFSTRPYIHDHDEYSNMPSKRNMTPATTLREPEPVKDDGKMIQSLMKVHEQLQKLSSQIEQKMAANPKIVNLENQLYKKMELVVEKVSQLEMRENERETKRISKEKERKQKRYNSSMKEIEKIGKQLLDFKVDT